MDYQELIERLRFGNTISITNVAANAIEYLLAENERLKHNLTTTEQTMREYQELAAKRLEEIERLKEIKMAGEIMRDLLKQRDELLAALEQFATWGRIQHKAQSKGGHATFDMLLLKDEIDLAEAAIASVKGQK